MGYRSYMGGFCAHCGRVLGQIEVAGGRDRHYCNDTCRKAASRERLKRDMAVSRNEVLVSLWNENGITGDLRQRLLDILIKHGKEAGTRASDAVVMAIKEVHGHYMSREYYDGGNKAELDRLRQAHFELMYKHTQLRTEKERLERQLMRERLGVNK